jgi:hypothetical protein
MERDERDERDEFWQVRSWRYEQALELGLTAHDAAAFADGDGDLAALRRLIEQAGCDPHVAAEILV